MNNQARNLLLNAGARKYFSLENVIFYTQSKYAVQKRAGLFLDETRIRKIIKSFEEN